MVTLTGKWKTDVWTRILSIALRHQCPSQGLHTGLAFWHAETLFLVPTVTNSILCSKPSPFTNTIQLIPSRTWGLGRSQGVLILPI